MKDGRLLVAAFWIGGILTAALLFDDAWQLAKARAAAGEWRRAARTCRHGLEKLQRRAGR